MTGHFRIATAVNSVFSSANPQIVREMPMNALSEALQSGTILLREGLEALLVIAALAAFLNRAGFPEKVRSLYAGAGLAILANARPRSIAIR